LRRTITVQNAPGSSVPGCEETNACFIPNRMTVDPGDIIMWTNPDTVSHFVTGCTPSAWLKRGVPGVVECGGGPFDSGIIMPGQTFSVRLTETGIYNYFCTAHPWMEGAVIVREGISSPPPSSVPTLKTSSNLILDLLPTTFAVKGSDSRATITFSGELESTDKQLFLSGATIKLVFTGFTLDGKKVF